MFFAREASSFQLPLTTDNSSKNRQDDDSVGLIR